MLLLIFVMILTILTYFNFSKKLQVKQKMMPQKNVETMELLKYLGDFWSFPEIPLFFFNIHLILTFLENFVMI